MIQVVSSRNTTLIDYESDFNAKEGSYRELDEYFEGKVWIDNDTLSYVDFQDFGVFEVSINTSLSDPKVIGISAIVNEVFDTSVDIAINTKVFAKDRNDKFHFLANERVLEAIYKPSSSSYLPPDDFCLSSNEVEDPGRECDISYFVKVLAFNRPSSLQRLLVSLQQAIYLDYNITLDIFVDYNRTVEVRNYINL
jgi:hypothetical protein